MKQEQSPICYLRFFHALPSSLSLDCYIDEKRIAKDLLYEDFTKYKLFTNQEHQITLCRHKETEPLLTQTLHLSSERVYTLVVYGANEECLKLVLLNEPNKPIPSEHLLARCINLSCIEEPLKLCFQDTRPEFKKLTPGHYTSYLAFPPDTYHLNLLECVEKTPLFVEENRLFKLSRYYALYIVGGIENYPLKVITSIEGNSLYQF